MFLAQVFVELNLDANCLSVCESLMGRGLKNSSYLMVQQAASFRNIKGTCSYEVLDRIGSTSNEKVATCYYFSFLALFAICIPFWYLQHHH